MNKTIKQHLKDNKAVYITIGASLLIAALTRAIMRDVKSQHIDRGISVVADRGISVIADRSVVTNNISFYFFSKARRSGLGS